MKRVLATFLVMSGTAGLFAACNPTDETVDCIQICDNYQDCEQDNFDRSECASLCESKADVDDAFGQAVDDCQACIDNKSCSEQDACAAECAGVTYEDEDDSNNGNLAEAEACVSVCDNHEDCAEDTYDRSQCASNCENEADADPQGFAQLVLDCDDCIDDKACGEQMCDDSCGMLDWDALAAED